MPEQIRKAEQKNKAFFISILTMTAVTNFAAMMNTTSMSILLPVFMREFDADMTLVQWVVTAYLLATCIVAPIVGYISDRISLKKTFLLAVSGFGAATMLLGMMNGLYAFIALRAVQGFFGGMLMPLTQAMIYQLFPRQQQAQAISIWSTTNLLAPTLAPSLAGIISDVIGWRFIFFLEVPILLLVICMAVKLVPYYKTSDDTARHPFDLSGLALSVAGSLCLLMAFSNITVWGLFSTRVIVLTVIGFAALAAFFYMEHHKQHPLLHVKVFSYEGFFSSVVLICIGSMLINAANNILPVFLQNIRGLTTTQTAFVMLPAPLTVMFVVPLMGKYYDRIGPQKMLNTIMCMGIAACLALGGLDTATPIVLIVIALILRDLGGATVTMPATNMGMQAIPREYAAHAAAVTSWVRQCVISLTIGLAVTFQTARTNHYMDLFADMGESARYAQSYCAAMHDIFYLMIVCYLAGFAAVYFSKSRKK